MTFDVCGGFSGGVNARMYQLLSAMNGQELASSVQLLVALDKPDVTACIGYVNSSPERACPSSEIASGRWEDEYY